MLNTLRGIPHPKLIFLTTLVVLFLSIGGFILFSGSGNKNEDVVEPTQTPTPTDEVTPTEEPIEETPVPTKKVVPTARPTSKPSPTPTNPAATSTPVPTSTPIPSPTSAPDTSAPTLDMTGPSDGSTVTFDNFCFPLQLSDNVTKSSDIEVRVRFDSQTWGSWGHEYSPCYSAVPNGQHTFSAQARDAAGNVAEKTSIFTVAK